MKTETNFFSSRGNQEFLRYRGPDFKKMKVESILDGVNFNQAQKGNKKAVFKKDLDYFTQKLFKRQTTTLSKPSSNDYLQQKD